MTGNTNRRRFSLVFWNGSNIKSLSRIELRESLVPAAAVIPAQLAYIKIVAVKRLVVGCLPDATLPRSLCGGPSLLDLHPVDLGGCSAN